MSYEKCKNIILKPKTNQIFITSATNNDRPLYYYKSEYITNETLNFEDKLLKLMLSMLDGNIQISQFNKHTIPFEYALLKVRNYYRENNIDEYGEKYDKRYELYNQELSKYVDINDWEKRFNFEVENRKLISNIEKNIYRKLYNKEFELFKNSIKEEIKGQFYLKDSFGRTIEYVRETSRGYSYRVYEEPTQDCLMDFKYAYIIKDRMGKIMKLLSLKKDKKIAKTLKMRKKNMNNNFDKWLDDLIENENIDLMNIYIVKKDGKRYEVMIKQIIDCLKLLNDEEKEQTRHTLETVLEEKGKILDCLIYLGVGCMKILDEVHSEEDEEAM